MRTCIIVTVYKDRYKKLIEHLMSPKSWISDKVDSVILLRQSNDEEDYTKYVDVTEKENISIVTCDATSIQEKRHFGYHWAIDNGYDALIWIDDDIKYYATHIDFKTKAPSGFWKNLPASIDDAISALIDCGERHPDAGVCTLFRCGFLATASNAKEYVNKCGHPSQLVYINIKNTSSPIYRIDYIESEEYMEDQCFYLDTLVAGLPMYVVGDYSFASYSAYDDKRNNRSLVYSDALGGMMKRNKQLIRHYLKYGGDLYLNKKGKLTAKIKYDKFFNVRELPIPYCNKGFDEGLMCICKSREVDDAMVSEVIEYLRQKKQSAK